MQLTQVVIMTFNPNEVDPEFNLPQPDGQVINLEAKLPTAEELEDDDDALRIECDN